MSLPVLLHGQRVELGLVSNGETRWFPSRVVGRADDMLSLVWPMDTNRFLPVLLPVVAQDRLLLAARAADSQPFAADVQVHATHAEAIQLDMRVCSSWRPLDRRAAARVTTNLRAERAEGRVAAAPRPRRWLASLVGLALVGLMVLGVGAHQLGDTSHPGGEQPTPLAAVSLRSAARQRPAAARPSRSHVWSAYGYAIQAPQPLWPALEFIRARGGFDWVLDVLDAGQTQVRFGSLPPRTLGVYNAQQNEVVLADALQIANVEVVAATLVHEATHLSDAQHGRWQNSTSACLTFERQAFSNEAAFWRAAFGPEGKFAPGDAWESALNNLLVSGTSENLVEAYADECGSLAQ